MAQREGGPYGRGDFSEKNSEISKDSRRDALPRGAPPQGPRAPCDFPLKSVQ